MEKLTAAVVDSSVLLKWFRPEEPHDEVARALRKAYVEARLELVIPDLAAYEIANVLRYRGSEVLAVQAVESLFDLRIPIYRPDQPTLREAIKQAFQCPVTVYDAMFLSVSRTLRLPLVTADRPFYQAIARLPGVIFLSDLTV